MTYPKIVVSGTHRQIGRSYGEQARAKIKESVSGYVTLLQSMGGALKEMRAFVEPQRALLAESAPWLLEELEGLAEGAEVGLLNLLIMNSRSELISSLSPGATECTSVAVGPARSIDSKPRLAQNWDWLALMRDMPLILDVRPNDRPAYVTFCEPGQLAKIGVNSEGVAVGLNFLTPPRGTAIGIPVHLLLRIILSGRTVYDALERIRWLPFAGGAHFMLADKTGEIASVEIASNTAGSNAAKFSLNGVTPRPHAPDPHPSLLTHANDYERIGEPRQRPCRSARLERLLDGRRPGRDVLFEVLRDHESGAPEQICSHQTAALASCSIASFVLEPAGDTADPTPAMWVVEGAPCDGALPVRYAP